MNEEERQELAELQELPIQQRTILAEIELIPRSETRASDPENNPNETEPDGDPADASDGDRFAISISSEAQVPRWYGTEILDHSSGAVDLTRAANGLSFLVDHDTGDQVGIVENVALGADRKLRGL